MDIALIVDLSMSVGSSVDIYFRRLFEFVTGFMVGENQTRFGAVTFNEVANVSFTLDAFTDIIGYFIAIYTFPVPSGQTNIADAFRVTRNNLFGKSGDRPDVPNVCILFSDGLSTREMNETLNEADQTRPFCTIISVSIGNLTDEVELKMIADGDRFFEVLNYDLLSTIRLNLTNTACDCPESKYTL